MTNKLVISRYGNDQYRFFTVNQPILTAGRFFDRHSWATTDEPLAKEITTEIEQVNLVDDVTISRYEVTVGIPRAFEGDEAEWDRITEAVTEIIAEAVFGPSAVFEVTLNDRSDEYKRQESCDASLHDLRGDAF